MIGHPAIYAAQAIASGLGATLASRSRRHLPIALLLPFGLAADLALEACGPHPSGLRFALALLAGQVYPWAVVGAVSVSLRGVGSWGRKWAGKSHPGAPTCAGGCAHGAVRRGLACEAIPAVSPSGGRSIARKDEGPGPLRNPSPSATYRRLTESPRRSPRLGPLTGTVGPSILPPSAEPFGSPITGRPRSMAIIAHALALATLFTIYAALLLSSGLRGPALARVYAVAQAVVAVVLVGVVWRWEKRRRDVAPARRRRGQASGRPLRLMPGGQPARGQRGGRGGEDMARGLDAVGNDCGSVSLPDAATARPPTATEIAAIICAGAEVANAPAYLGLPHWVGARSVYALAYCALIVVQSHALLRTRRPP